MRRLSPAIFVVALLSATPSLAQTIDGKGADALVLRARHDGMDGFCTDPRAPLPPRARALCPMAAQIPQCDALMKACADDAPQPDKPSKWDLSALAAFFSTLASGVVWGLVALVVGLIAFFVVRALRHARRDVDAASPTPPAAVVTHDPVALALETMSDAELLLQRANEHASRGELDRAALLYLAASLRALDRRGAIRIARHRTNGEYVRACKDAEATPQLRAIVRAVDEVQFGRVPPTAERVADVGARAAWIVRAAAATLLTLLIAGCSLPDRGGHGKADDPSGDDLLISVLKQQGVDAARLGSPLLSLPMPGPRERSPLIVVDASRTPLEDETRAHLTRWVKEGGHLLLAGNVAGWPEDLGAHPKGSSSTKVTFRFADVSSVDSDEDEEEEEEATDDSGDESGTHAVVAVVAEARGMEWAKAFAVATTEDKVTYAAIRDFNRGVVVGLAGDDLLTNAGLSVVPNGRALFELLARYGAGRKIRLASPEDGISPPSNPLSALLHAGLGLSLVHAALATALLMLAFGIRQARAKSSPPPARRAFSEHVRATGTLYARAHLAPHALYAYARFVDGRLRSRMPRSMTDPVAFLALRAQADPAHCARVWALATSARSADRPRGDELITLRDLRALYAATLRTEPKNGPITAPNPE